MNSISSCFDDFNVYRIYYDFGRGKKLIVNDPHVLICEIGQELNRRNLAVNSCNIKKIFINLETAKKQKKPQITREDLETFLQKKDYVNFDGKSALAISKLDLLKINESFQSGVRDKYYTGYKLALDDEFIAKAVKLLGDEQYAEE